MWIPHPLAHPRAVKLTILERDNKFHRPTVRTTGPIVWRHAFPTEIQTRLVSFTNPAGSVNNSELELTGSFLHNEVAAQCFDIRERTTKAATDFCVEASRASASTSSCIVIGCGLTWRCSFWRKQRV